MKRVFQGQAACSLSPLRLRQQTSQSRAFALSTIHSQQGKNNSEQRCRVQYCKNHITIVSSMSWQTKRFACLRQAGARTNMVRAPRQAPSHRGMKTQQCSRSPHPSIASPTDRSNSWSSLSPRLPVQILTSLPFASEQGVHDQVGRKGGLLPVHHHLVVVKVRSSLKLFQRRDVQTRDKREADEEALAAAFGQQSLRCPS